MCLYYLGLSRGREKENQKFCLLFQRVNCFGSFSTKRTRKKKRPTPEGMSLNLWCNAIWHSRGQGTSPSCRRIRGCRGWTWSSRLPHLLRCRRLRVSSHLWGRNAGNRFRRRVHASVCSCSGRYRHPSGSVWTMRTERPSVHFRWYGT